MLETPFPLTAIVGLYLLVAPRLPKGAGVLVAWAFLPVVANGYYWFHDVRMFFETAPAWITLAVIAAVALAGGLDSKVEVPLAADGDGCPPAAHSFRRCASVVFPHRRLLGR